MDVSFPTVGQAWESFFPEALRRTLVDPGRNIVCATGDGGLMMNVQELETARRLDANFTVVIFNDNDYGLISWKQQMNRGASTSTRIDNPDFSALADSFDVTGYSSRTVDELNNALEEAFFSDRLALVEVLIDTSVNFDLLENLEDDGILKEGDGFRASTIG